MWRHHMEDKRRANEGSKRLLSGHRLVDAFLPTSTHGVHEPEQRDDKDNCSELAPEELRIEKNTPQRSGHRYRAKIADRGIHGRVGSEGWETICREMESAFRAGNFEQGVLGGIERVSSLLKSHYASDHRGPNDLPDRPVVL